ncbi:MAG: hypothetical protein J6Y02_22910 [Pseudobutyrivibrio sp.]|nr:hypothetical protein [Pseudobutyrivibrio sp.]
MSNYLIHFNKNHSKSNGQFISGDGDGDGINNDRANQRKELARGAAFGRNASKISKEVGKGLGSASNIVDKAWKTKQNPRKDLSKISDKELQQILNRERMEQEYNRYFNTPTENKGKAFVKDALSIAVDVAAITTAAFTVYSIVKNK